MSTGMGRDSELGGHGSAYQRVLDPAQALLNPVCSRSGCRDMEIIAGNRTSLREGKGEGEWRWDGYNRW